MGTLMKLEEVGECEVGYGARSGHFDDAAELCVRSLRLGRQVQETLPLLFRDISPEKEVLSLDCRLHIPPIQLPC